MIKNITIGNYIPLDSIIHKLDARLKLILMISLICITFLTFNYLSLFLVTGFVIFFVILSKIPLSIYFRGLKFIFVIIIFTLFINLFYGTGKPILSFGVLSITEDSINRSLFMSLRLINIVVLSLILTFTTLPTDLTIAFETLMKPLGIFKINIGEISMMLSIAIRFIPTLLEEIQKIMDAQKSRGADIENGNIIKRIKALIPILVPLFVSSFRRAYDLACAMECRCYQYGNKRSRLKILQFTKLDLFSLCFVILLFFAVIISNIYLPSVTL